MTKIRLGLSVVLAAVFATANAKAEVCRFRGTVKDASGAAVAGAEVRAGSNSQSTDANGRFDVDGECGTSLTVRAAGFAEERLQPSKEAPSDVVLHVSRADQRITVDATAESAETTSIGPEELRSSPQVTLDSRLREVPGFTLFRRTPSWAANPTTQGISLHGVGASGASRGLALLDGVPLNDPFGGWIYWGRVAPVTLASAEVAQTSASNLYGSDAVGGVVNLLRDQSTETHATLESSVGNLFTPDASGVVTVGLGKWAVTGVGDGFRTNGYVPVPSNARGPVDTVTSSNHQNGRLLLERSYSGGRAFVGGNLYGESRQNGTVLQTNSATIREMEAGADWSGRAGDWSLRGFGGTESLRQTFTSINSLRTTEALTRDQTVPAAQAGTSLLWSKIFGRNLLLAGAEARWVDGESYEWAFANGAATSKVRSGGGQRREGFFFEDRVRLGGRALFTLGGRYDHWSNVSGFTSTTPLIPTVVARYQRFADRAEDAFSPKAGVSVSANRWITLHASAAGGYRAPTLNELYRSFRVGNVLTNANSALKAEHSVNVEGGASLALGAAGTVRASYFWTQINDAVANVTLTTTPALITRMRQNLGKLRSQGLDLAWERRFAQRWSVTTAYEFANPVVAEFAADPTLIGNWIPQVARHNATVSLGYTGTRWMTHVAVRGQGKQFDDDRNTLPLGGYATLDAFVSRVLGRGVEIFAAGENLTDRRYEVGKTPTVTVGPPVLVRGGVRWTLGKR